LKKMKLGITHMLTKSTSPFYDIIPGRQLKTTAPSMSSLKSWTSRLPTMPS
jgi:hypothetical protein